ncbi:MAG: HAD family phosphatase [Micavibrio sp.]|nr:HAD family phosphatase [Micavibrio sp.]
MDTLLIFDCDGTLVNSEHIYNAINSDLLGELGYPEYTLDVCLDLFGGHSWSVIREIVESKHGKPLPDDLVERYVRHAEVRMKEEFLPCDNADALLGRMHGVHKLCVASNGERKNVLQSLSVTNLKQYFADHHVFTKAQVPRPKPSPDLFLFACDQMEHDYKRSIVLEDSPAGVQAAVAANIKVLGYVGSAHDKDRQAKRLRDAGAEIIIECLKEAEKHI